ncbi:MAG TPA: SPOR domain-containing protein [Gemmatimonadales bacterium]|nr:SPOR domain-containing protein [Gemmatimonadales bacterium]
MPIREWCFVLAGLALWGCGSRGPADASRPDEAQAVPREAAGARPAGVAIRIPAEGGTPRAYRLPGLAEIPNAIRGKLPAVERIIGLDPEAEFLFVMTNKKEMLSLDLGSARVDTVAKGVVQATVGPDGTLYTVDAKRRVVSVARRVRFAWPQPLGAAPRELFGASDQRLVAVDPPQLITVAPNQPPTSRTIPVGTDVTATRWGDLIAVASDSGVLLLDPLRSREPTFIPLADHPRALVFSPSGHRIYVARRSGLGLAVIDRYERAETDEVRLPTPIATIRLDPLGRWLLARPMIGDTAWVVDLPVKRLVGAVPTSWRADLPAIAPDGALLARHGEDIVAYRPDTVVATGRLRDAAADLWILTSWRPRGRRSAFADAEQAGEPGTAADSAGPEGPLYVQVSTSQNEAWSSEMAQQLTRAGLAAKVLAPKGPEDGYRVVLGPYATRAQAEAIGRKLGRPFWIYQPTR